MHCEIATIIGDDGRTAALTVPGTVVVYKRLKGMWNIERKMRYSPDENDTLSDLRKKIRELISFLEECRIFVAQSATGALYFELMKAGCSVYESLERPEDFLEDVLDQEEKEQINKLSKRADAIPGPYERAPGEFVVSIKEIQGVMPGITSKQILQGFIREGNFHLLEVICDHIPPWLEMESEQKGFHIESEARTDHEIRLLLQR